MQLDETAHTEFIICNHTIKGRNMVAWMGMAIDATSRLWMAGVVSIHRDRDLADRLLHQVRACCQCVRKTRNGLKRMGIHPHS
jgi:hypothetical protein